MKILVIGGTGRIGSKVVDRLRAAGHDIVIAAPSTGIDIISGEGLDMAMADTQVVIDLANSPSFEDAAVLAFFQTAGHNILAAEAKAGVAHHVALSVVGTDKLAASGYFRGKIAQEKLIRNAGVAYTIIHSTSSSSSCRASSSPPVMRCGCLPRWCSRFPRRMLPMQWCRWHCSRRSTAWWRSQVPSARRWTHWPSAS